MAGNETKEQTDNINAFKAGVQSVAPVGKPYKFVQGDHAADADELSHVGVKVHTENGGLSVDRSKTQEIELPSGKLSVKEIFANLAAIPADSLKMTPPGKATDWYKEIGQHEGGHLGQHLGKMDGGLGDEIIGDKTAMNGDNPDVEQALFGDVRALGAIVRPHHATGPGLKPGEENPSTIKMHAGAKMLHDMVASDLLGRGTIQSVEELQTLQQKKPKAVYDSVSSLKKGGAFDDIDGSRGEYVRQYVDDYMKASEKWIKGIEAPAANNTAPKPAAPAAPGNF